MFIKWRLLTAEHNNLAFGVYSDVPLSRRHRQATDVLRLKTPAEAYAIASQPKSDSGQTEISIAVLLHSPSGLRNAIILREIFGPPRSLQPLELVGSA